MTLEGDVLLSVTVNPGAKQTALIGYDIWTKSLKISVKARAEGKIRRGVRLPKLPKFKEVD